jgi:hypothetical protein
MAFNINDFKTAIEKRGGLARPNLFTVEFFSPRADNLIWNNSDFGNQDIKFFCQNVTFPGLNVNVFEYRPNNIDVPQSIPIAIDKQQLECVFMVDDSFKIMNYFHAWFRQVVNFTTNGSAGAPIALPGTATSTSQQFSYELGYKKEYSQMMQITMYSRSPSSVNFETSPGTITYDNKYVCRLYDVYPVQVGSINLEWAANDSYTTLPVAFSYSAYDMTSLSAGVEVIGPGIPI